MRRVLKFIFNVARNLSLALVLSVALLLIFVGFFPKSTETFLEEITGQDIPPVTAPIEEEVRVSMNYPHSESIRSADNTSTTVVIGNKKTQLTFPAKEFVLAKSSGRSQYPEIRLDNGITSEVRVSYTKLKSILEEAGLSVFSSKDGVINLAQVRHCALDKSSTSFDAPLLVTTRGGVCNGVQTSVPASKKAEFLEKLKEFYGVNK